MSHDDTDKAHAIALAEIIEQEMNAVLDRHTPTIAQEMMAVLERHTRMPDRGGGPRYSRHVALHATSDLLGCLMQSAIAVEGEPAQRTCQRLVDYLQLKIARDDHVPLLVTAPTTRPS